MGSIFWAQRDRTARREELLVELKRDVERVALDPGSPIVLLCGDSPNSTSAESFAECRLLVINDSRLELRSRDDASPRRLDVLPREVLVAIGVHEYVHLRIGGALWRVIERHHPDVVRLFRERILPDWLAGRIVIAEFDEYMRESGWLGLYGPWEGSHAIEFGPAAAALEQFYTVLALGEMRPQGDTLWHPAPGQFRSLDALMEGGVPVGALDRLYNERPSEIGSLVVLGFAIAKKLGAWLADAFGADTRWALEEGFATYVARLQTGLSFDEVNRWAPQDSWKIDMAERIEQAEPTKAMVDGVRSLEDLFAFGREIGVIT